MDATVAVTDVRSVGSNTVAVKFESPTGFDAEPGQFVRLTGTVEGEAFDEDEVGEEYSRFYTLSSPDNAETFEVTIEVDEQQSGPFSRYLATLDVGDELELDGPHGRNHYEDESRAVVLAGGPGVGPAVAIAERAVGDGNEAAVVYRDDEPAHEKRLNGLREAGADVIVIGMDTPLAEAVAAVLNGEADEQVFVYGFAEFVEEAREAIEAVGGDPGASKVENFG